MPSLNKLEVFNETCIFFAGFFALSYTEICDPGLVRNSFGWLSIILFITMATTNIVFMLKEKLKLIMNKIKKKKDNTVANYS